MRRPQVVERAKSKAPLFCPYANQQSINILPASELLRAIAEDMHKRDVFKWVMVLLALLAVVCFHAYVVQHGLNFTDEPWQIINSQCYREVPQAVLSHAIGHVWGEAFGYSLVSFRILATLLRYLTMCVLLLPLYHKTRNRFLTACVFVLMAAFYTQNLWGWDTPNALFWSLALVGFYFYLVGRNVRLLALCGVFNALFALCRIPSLLAIPVETVVLCYLAFSEKQGFAALMKQLGILLASSLATFVLMTFVLMGGLGDYLHAMLVAKSSEHGLAPLLARYYTSMLEIKDVLARLVAFASVCFVAERGLEYIGMRHKYKRVSFCLFVGVGALYLFRWLWHRYDEYGFTMCYVLISLVAMTLLYYVVRSLKEKDRPGRISAVALAVSIALFALIPPAGSNTGLFKISNVTLIPMLFVLSRSFESKRNYSSFIWVVAIACALYSLASKKRNLYEDAGLPLSTVKVEQKGISVYTTEERAAFVNTICQQTERFKAAGKSVMYVGMAPRFLFEYMNGYRAPYTRNDFWLSLDSEAYALPTKEFLDDKGPDVVFVIPHYPGHSGNADSDNMTERLIRDSGYAMLTNNEDYRIYQKGK